MTLVTALATTIVCIAANAFFAVADFRAAGFVLKNSAEVDVPVRAIPYLGALKLVGAAGLTIGLIALPWLGVAAGVGLTLFFSGAVAAHVKAGVWYNIAFPGAMLLLAGASAGYLLHLANG